MQKSAFCPAAHMLPAQQAATDQAKNKHASVRKMYLELPRKKVIRQ